MAEEGEKQEEVGDEEAGKDQKGKKKASG